MVRTWGRQGTGEGEFDVRDLSDAGNPGSGDIDVGVDGTVYVADGSNHRIQVFTPDGTFIRQMGSFGSQPGQFSWRDSLRSTKRAAHTWETIGTGTLTKFGSDGGLVWRNAGGSRGTGPTAQLPDGRIVSLGDSGVAILDPATGNVIERWGKSGSGIGDIGSCDIAVDGVGNEYLLGCAPDHLQVFDLKHQLIGGVYGPNDAVLYPVFGPTGAAYGLTADRLVNDDIYVLKDSLLTP